MISSITIIILLCVLVLISSISTYLMYFKRWREFNPENLITFPEEAVAEINEIKNTNIELQRKIEDQNKELISDVNKILSEINNQISSLNEQVQSFRSLVEERAIELKRYKDGYNFSITKSFVMGLIDNIKYIEKNLERDDIKNSDFARFLEASKDKLDLLLAGQGVEYYIPKTGIPITEVDGCKAVETMNTENDENVNLIHSILKPGYKIQLNSNETKIIYEAEVIVFKKEEKNKDE